MEIFDQAYNLRGSDADYILKLAEYVDAKMRAVSEQTHTVDTARLAVLAALNIADEYHLLKRNHDGGAVDYLKRAHHLSDALDEVLEKSAGWTSGRRAVTDVFFGSQGNSRWARDTVRSIAPPDAGGCQAPWLVAQLTKGAGKPGANFFASASCQARRVSLASNLKADLRGW